MGARVKVVRLNERATLPARGSAGAAGFDLSASESVTVPARGRAPIPTGIALQAPPDTYARVAPRSGLGLRGIDVGAGVVDADYEGEVKVVLINHTDAPFAVNAGDRIAQIIFERIVVPELAVVASVAEFGASKRGAGGFGSTGV